MRHALVIALVGCNQFYGLDETDRAPPVQLPDEDGDGAPDERDNCIGLANPTQNDEDSDTRGDLCDNCPLVANPQQEDVGDGDGVGDHCDPHPVVRGDCLVLLDSFREADQFAVRWNATNAVATPRDGDVVLEPGGAGGMLSREHGGEPYDIQLLARATLGDNSELGVIVNGIVSPRAGIFCSVSRSSAIEPMLTFGNSSIAASGPMSSVPIGSLMLARLATSTIMGGRRIACRIDHGVARGTVQTTSPAESGGAPGVIASTRTEVLGIALYRFTASCPEKVLR